MHKITWGEKQEIQRFHWKGGDAATTVAEEKEHTCTLHEEKVAQTRAWRLLDSPPAWKTQQCCRGQWGPESRASREEHTQSDRGQRNTHTHTLFQSCNLLTVTVCPVTGENTWINNRIKRPAGSSRQHQVGRGVRGGGTCTETRTRPRMALLKWKRKETSVFSFKIFKTFDFIFLLKVPPCWTFNMFGRRPKRGRANSRLRVRSLTTC